MKNSKKVNNKNKEDLFENHSVELLKALHILTIDGKINQDSRRKLKQVQHLVQFIEKLINDIGWVDDKDFNIVDHGAGKSYLGFILQDYLFKDKPNVKIWGVETRGELVEKSNELAKKIGFSQMQFLHMSAAEAANEQPLQIPSQIELVTALHACDTATDDAIDFALKKHARALALVPCCQAEMARYLRQNKALQLSKTPLAELWRHPLHTREVGSQLTNVLRCLYLESQGYSVTVTELVGWEHSMKNELILARYTGQKKRSAGERLKELLSQFGLENMIEIRFKALA